MRLADQVSRIGVETLRFDAEQARRSSRPAPVGAAPEHVERLIELTEGWPASVVLAGLALEWLDLGSLEQALADPRLKRDIYSYLAEQVYRNEDVATRAFSTAPAASRTSPRSSRIVSSGSTTRTAISIISPRTACSRSHR